MTLTGVELSEEQEAFVTSQVKTGHFEDAGAVVRAALRTMKRIQAEDAVKAEALEDLLEQGVASGIAPDGVFERVRARAGLPPRVRG